MDRVRSEAASDGLTTETSTGRRIRGGWTRRLSGARVVAVVAAAAIIELLAWNVALQSE